MKVGGKIQRVTSGRAAVLMITAAVAVSCSQKEASNEVRLEPKTDKTISDKVVPQDGSPSREVSFRVIGTDTAEALVKEGSVVNPESLKSKEILSGVPDSKTLPLQFGLPEKSVFLKDGSLDLLLAYPIDLLGEQNLFGGVITGVSATEDSDLGDLKLSDLTPLNVRLLLAGASTGRPSVALFGCAQNCSEGSEQRSLLDIPVEGVDTKAKFVVLNLSALGQTLNLVGMMDPLGLQTGLRAVSSKTTVVDFSLNTLVFEIQTKMVSIFHDPRDPATPFVTVTARWYLKLTSGLNPAFTTRVPRQEVGFFETQRGAQTLITRHSLTSTGGQAPVHYYLKGIPEEFKAPFARAFDSWNGKFKDVIGKPLLRYEFLDVKDPRYNSIVTGDIRYNVLEWDLVNQASYGGLGPSIANPQSGEIFSANVLVQGPTIMKLYKEWYKVSGQIRIAREAGHTALADSLMLRFNRRLNENEKPKSDLKLKLGDLEMRVTSRLPELQDEVMQRTDFEDLPEDFDFAGYMNGYFHDLVAHEMGHNVGLRHNFKGNLGATNPKVHGGVSRSIMEYLGRPFRHLDDIGEYDVMAISYGYKGVTPEHSDWFCTDENSYNPASKIPNSAECTTEDATSDPYSFYEARLVKTVNLIVARGSTEAPEWKADDMARELRAAVVGLSSYAASASTTAGTWTAFFGKAGRPATASEVKAYVVASLKSRICDPSLESVVAAKSTEAAKKATRENLAAYREKVAALAASAHGAVSKEELACE